VSRAATFLAFAERLRVKLSRGQRVAAAVAFDGVDPRDFDGEDADTARAIFGEVATVPPEARSTAVFVCGARAGKTSLFCALRALHLALTVPVDGLAPGEQAFVVIVAPDLRLARQCLSFAKGHAKADDRIRRCVIGESADGFVLARDGREVSVECLPATRGGSAVRGRTLLGAVLDEAAFFRDESAIVNDAELYRALLPRIVAGGQLVIASTPWAEEGLLYELHAAQFGAPRSAIVCHAPTLAMRDDVILRARVALERVRDPDNAAREYDGTFFASGASSFFDPQTVAAALHDVPLPMPPDPSAVVFVGADFGFRSDASSIVVAQRVGPVVVVADVHELRPSKGAPLQPSAVVDAFALVAKRYGATSIAADLHYSESVRELLARHGLGLVALPNGAEGKAAQYVAARSLLREGKVKLPNHARLLAQLKAVVAKPTSGGGLAISSQRRASGGHGDVASACVAALWRASSYRPPPDYAGVLHVRTGRTLGAVPAVVHTVGGEVVRDGSVHAAGLRAVLTTAVDAGAQRAADGRHTRVLLARGRARWRREDEGQTKAFRGHTPIAQPCDPATGTTRGPARTDPLTGSTQCDAVANGAPRRAHGRVKTCV
jgi:hypothetical protein